MRALVRILVVAAAEALVLVAAAAAALGATPQASPSGTTSPDGLGSTGHGTGFIVLAIILVVALVFSGWRLRRDR